jgi:hypothetical protein
MEEDTITMPMRYEALKFLSSYDARTYQDLGDYRRSREQIVAYLSTIFRESVLFDKNIGFSNQQPFIVRDIVLYNSLLKEARCAIIRELLTGLDWPPTETSLTMLRE